MLFALGSALCYGISDVAGGLLSRRVHFGLVAVLGQLGGLLVTLVAAPLVDSDPTIADFAWGALSGLGTGIGMLFLFRGISAGALSVVVPVVAVGGLALPVLVGVVVLGERPSLLAWLGIVVAVPALWFVSLGDDEGTAAGVVSALISSVGIAVQYLALAQAGPDAGVWPVLAGRVTAVLAILPAVRWRKIEAKDALGAGAVGALAAIALVLYLLATRQQLVVIAVVLSSLYPVIPVLVGITALRERLTRRQSVGLLAAAASVVFLGIA
ncbi:GRP family sugar transporter [Labedaea rhizosphaerae]|uniref:Glucose uptake protein GlcU n=1 Tax=Labedaea rhizosphaerae TaxID=598644 RepID=A0A4R6S9S5_LABRH|nr:GRP family sugar transporter [Labedaea rhizosphaerae]TDP96682.1 glucose uptake protein GlcU [Labedaea rhizosphaerae]